MKILGWVKGVCRFAMPNGKAKGMDDSEFDKEQLEKGREVEFEHTNDPEIAKEIAKDHLEEHESYYIELEKMEKKLEREEKKD